MKGVVLNPIIFMTVLGIVVNVIIFFGVNKGEGNSSDNLPGTVHVHCRLSGTDESWKTLSVPL